jgi:hypothetical protein
MRLTSRRNLFVPDSNRQQGQYIGNGAAEVVRRNVAAEQTTGEAAQQAATAGADPGPG